jgi:hypothetical protein
LIQRRILVVYEQILTVVAIFAIKRPSKVQPNHCRMCGIYCFLQFVEQGNRYYKVKRGLVFESEISMFSVTSLSFSNEGNISQFLVI